MPPQCLRFPVFLGLPIILPSSDSDGVTILGDLSQPLINFARNSDGLMHRKRLRTSTVPSYILMGSTDFVRAMFMMPEQSSPEVNKGRRRKESAQGQTTTAVLCDGLGFQEPLIVDRLDPIVKTIAGERASYVNTREQVY